MTARQTTAGRTLVVALFCLFLRTATSAPTTISIGIPGAMTLTYGYLNATAMRFRLEGATTGWVGLLINVDVAGMGYGDFVVGSVSESGEVTLGDYHNPYNPGNAQPAYDTQQDAFPIAGSIDNGVTTLEFFRMVDTGDKEEDFTLTEGVYIGFALGPSGNKVSSTHTFRGHFHTSASRAVISLNLIDADDWPLKPNPPPTPTPVPTPTPTPASSPTPTPTPTPAPQPSPTPSNYPSPTPTPYSTPSPTPTRIPIPSPSPTPTLSLSPAPISTSVPSPSPVYIPNSSPPPTTVPATDGSFISNDGKFSVKWSSDGNEFTFTMKAKTTGWVGVGFSRDTYMEESDMVVGSISGSEPFLGDFYADGYDVPDYDDEQNVDLVEGVYKDGWTSFTFTRLDDTGDEDMDIPLADSPFLLWAYGGNGDVIEIDDNDYEFGQHITQGVLSVDFENGGAETVHEFDWKKFHGGLMMAAWLLFTVWSIVIARFMKGNFGIWWFRLHVLLNIFVLALTAVGAGIIIWTMVGKDVPQFTSLHHIFGLIVLVGCFVQGALGALADRMWDPSRTEIPIFPDKIHWWFGRALVVFSWITIILGMNLYGADLLSTSMVLIYLWLFDICGYFAIFTYLDVKRSEDNMQLAELKDVNDDSDWEEDIGELHNPHEGESNSKNIILFASMIIVGISVVVLSLDLM